eukprot:CAMPEP_0202962852 /NCGR_PEP_ID=MMETSP1396-20130829/6898_1 /ASSEMBLY_ACC=CAM_ASM_000872 /TAXON_ID= /ORGANISM="Pseudokeronopsis sp., Strain Brazil" /LENGTH=81 /DNA_ID=CAMNT_0049683667 /DNA_START=652 /DNA_END=897 /DNA_ORIENTATION=-
MGSGTRVAGTKISLREKGCCKWEMGPTIRASGKKAWLMARANTCSSMDLSMKETGASTSSTAGEQKRSQMEPGTKENLWME